LKTLLALLGSVVLLSGAVRAAPAPGSVTEGIIAAVDASVVTVTTRAGSQVRLAINSDTVVIQRRPVKLEDIKRNEFVGVTARREPDGSLTAISINIFPPEFKGRVREAQFVMDTGNVMTTPRCSKMFAGSKGGRFIFDWEMGPRSSPCPRMLRSSG